MRNKPLMPMVVVVARYRAYQGSVHCIFGRVGVVISHPWARQSKCMWIEKERNKIGYTAISSSSLAEEQSVNDRQTDK